MNPLFFAQTYDYLIWYWWHICLPLIKDAQ